MAPLPGEAPRAGALRPLNQPASLEVLATPAGTPKAVELEDGWEVVAEVRERWRVDDLNWQTGKQETRMYFELELEDGRLLTLFLDRVEGGWYRQPYG